MSKEAEIKKLEDLKKKADKANPKLVTAIQDKLKTVKGNKPVTK